MKSSGQNFGNKLWTILISIDRAILLSSILLILVACQSSQQEQNTTKWSYTDLRIISADFAENPNYDIVAAYTRESGSDIQIRLDLLNISPDIQSDIYIALDTQPGGTTSLPLEIESQIYWDTLITIPAIGNPVAYLPTSPETEKSKLTRRGDIIPRAYQDYQNDYLTISLNKFVFPKFNQLFRAQVFLIPVNSKLPADSIGPFQFDDSSHYRLPVLIAFWNVFPAYTPAQALRRWDGAHTGPFGERHGLKMLLGAVEDNKIPVTLLDLRTPTSLSALDYLSQLPIIKKLEREKLITLPDHIPGTISNTDSSKSTSQEFIIEWARINARHISHQFEFPLSSILYAPQLPPYQPEGYQTIFTLSEIQSNPVRLENTILIPLPFEDQEQQATDEGLSLDTRIKLLKSIDSDESDATKIHILGGSLPESNWGDPESVNATMQYIAEHPWIEPMTIDDILAMRSAPVASNSSLVGLIDSFSTPNNLLDDFNQTRMLNDVGAENLIYPSTWHSFLSLFSPLPPESDLLPDLRDNYFHQIGHLINAAKWAEQPFSLSDCEIDPDNDGQNECVLASEHYYALFENAGARLIFLFIRIKDKNELKSDVHQILGPTSQFLVGIGDPSAWDIDAGEAADSEGIHGAFSDSINSWDLYSPTSVSQDHLTFSSPDKSITKSFTFNNNSLSIEYTNVPPMVVKIPLILDPWERFSSDWGDRYSDKQIMNGWTWELSDGPTVNVTSNGRVKLHPFTASKHTLDERENPNYGYPPGHFIPFPIAIAEVETQSDNTSLKIQLDYR
jgi:hypothetical protein